MPLTGIRNREVCSSSKNTITTMPKLTLSFKGRFIDLHNLTQQSTTIGRAEACDIRIDSLAVAPLHACIELVSGACQVSPADDQPVYVNQRLIRESITLSHGDCLRIGKHELIFSDCITDLNPQKSRTTPPKKAPHADSNPFERLVSNYNTLPSGSVQILSGQHVGKIIPLQRGLTRLGLSGNECAVIAHRDDGYYLSHLEGKRSPRINRRSIGNRSVRLHEGAEIELGSIRMRFHEAIEQSAAM